MNFWRIKVQLRNLLGGITLHLNHSTILEVIMKSPLYLFVLILSVVVIGANQDSANAATYFVDGSNGNDSANGLVNSPWKTIAKANRTLKAGDTVIIKRGTYTESINPTNSGDAGNPITYTNHNSDNVLISGPGANSVQIGKNYIYIDGLNIKNDSPASGVQTTNIMIFGSYNKINNCQIINSKDKFLEFRKLIKESGITIKGGRYNQIENCRIKNLSFNGIKLDTANNTTIRNNEIVDNYANAVSITTSNSTFSGILVENNRLGGSATSDSVQFNGNYKSSNWALDQSNQGAVIRGNVIFNNAENGIDLKGTKYILIENNIIYGATADNDGASDGKFVHGGMGGITVGTGSTSSDVIIRGNLIYDNYAATRLDNGWKIYNNTLLGNNRDINGSNSTYTAPGEPLFVGIAAKYGVKRAAIKNNIIAGHNHGEICINTLSVQADINHNLYYNDKQTYLINFKSKGDWDKLSLDQWMSRLSNSSNISGKDQNSYVVSPGFSSGISLRPANVELNKNMVTLSSNSTAVDKGGALTTTTGGGSGDTININDAGYFCDGFGAVDGDFVRVGGNSAVKVTKVDYVKNVIVVDRKISWNKGDGVSLNYEGNGPDIGAAEYIGSTIPSPSLKIVQTE